MAAVCIHSQCSQIFLHRVYGEFVFVLEFWVNANENNMTKIH